MFASTAVGRAHRLSVANNKFSTGNDITVLHSRDKVRILEFSVLLSSDLSLRDNLRLSTSGVGSEAWVASVSQFMSSACAANGLSLDLYDSTLF